MRYLVILAIILMTFSCSNKDNSKDSKNGIFQTIQVDTLEKSIDVLNKNVQYIGFVDKFYFSNENEAYVELYFLKDQIDEAEYDKIVKLADSLIYQDDENSRHKFPESLATKYFDLRGLSKLKIYDNNNQFISNAEFSRVEYLNQNISPVFIAVFKTDKKIKKDGYYGISNFSGSFKPAKYSITKDTILTQNILLKLKEQKPYYGLENNGTHLYFSDNDAVLSIINSEKFAYIVLSTNNDFKVLYKSLDYENISELKIIPLNNKFPNILTRNVKPETDVMWDNLLYYDGKKYKSTTRQRNE